MSRTRARWALAVDTATDVRVGLAADGVAFASAAVTDRMQHAEQLTPLIAQVCDQAGVRAGDLELVVVGLGPGPFTGLRVGIATARVLAAVAQAGLHGVCSLDVLARQAVAGRPAEAAAEKPGEFLVATDARRREVYWARYDAAGRRLTGPAVGRPAELPALPVVGPGLITYPDLPALPGGPLAIDAGLLAGCGPELPSAGSEPLYLRRPDAHAPGAAKSVLATGERR